MAVIHALIAALARSAGKVLNTIFGWATALLFGRVNDDKQIAMSVATFGSVLWLVSVLGIFFPKFAAIALAAFVPDQDKYDVYIRWAMVASAVLIPFIVGAAKIAVKGEKQGGGESDSKIRKLLDGWPYTIGLSITLLLMMVFAPIMKAKMLVRRWRAEHIPIMVEPEKYTAAVDSIETVLENEGYAVVRQKADWLLRFPTKILSFFASKHVKDMVADQLTVLANPKFQVQLHPSDLIISGKADDTARIRSLIARRLLFTDALMTWDQEANELEQKMKTIWQRAHEENADFEPLFKELQSIDRKCDQTPLRYEEWEVLYRERLQLELFMLRKMRERGQDRRRAA
jgi:hypothetical protein